MNNRSFLLETTAVYADDNVFNVLPDHQRQVEKRFTEGKQTQLVSKELIVSPVIVSYYCIYLLRK